MISDRYLLGMRTGHLFAVIFRSRKVSRSRPEAFVGIKAARKEKAAFIRRYKAQGYYAAVGRRIPFDELERHIHIEPWDDSDAEPK